jgi:hypothetical protein
MVMRISRKRIISTNISAILAASILAILSKVLLPSAVNIEDFNSIFVKLLGFPVVASLYFILIYTHGAIVTQLFGKNAKLPNLQIGIRFGICFGLIFLLGMQEVVVNASPFSEWGIDFVTYQFFMGIGEAITALALCIIIAKYNIKKNRYNYPKENITSKKVLRVSLIALAFTIERTIAYETGIISSDINTFPIPCYGWTILFGIALGCFYVILLPIFREDKNPVSQSFKLVVITIGLCWIIFNSFIGWIIDGAMSDVLLRSGLDVAAIFIAVLTWVSFHARYCKGSRIS